MTNKKQADLEMRAEDFANSIKNDPKMIIAWAKKEIRQYEALIKMLEGK